MTQLKETLQITSKKFPTLYFSFFETSKDGILIKDISNNTELHIIHDDIPAICEHLLKFYNTNNE